MQICIYGYHAPEMAVGLIERVYAQHSAKHGWREEEKQGGYPCRLLAQRKHATKFVYHQCRHYMCNEYGYMIEQWKEAMVYGEQQTKEAIKGSPVTIAWYETVYDVSIKVIIGCSEICPVVKGGLKHAYGYEQQGQYYYYGFLHDYETMTSLVFISLRLSCIPCPCCRRYGR